MKQRTVALRKRQFINTSQNYYRNSSIKKGQAYDNDDDDNDDGNEDAPKSPMAQCLTNDTFVKKETMMT